MIKFGFIGTGNMAGALIEAASGSGGYEFLLSNRSPQKAEKYAKLTGGKVCGNKDVAAEADYIWLGVKPQMIEGVMAEIAPILQVRKDRFVLVSMLACTTIDRIRELAGGQFPVIRIMPNTPVSIGQGIILYSCSDQVAAEEKAEFLKSMTCAGMVTEIEERLIDAGSGLTGCGPAYVFMFIEAMADGAVACGIPRAMATEMAAKMVAGSAELALATGKNPEELKNAVCSPGGTTIQGVRRLEEGAFRGTVMDAVIASFEKHI